MRRYSLLSLCCALVVSPLTAQETQTLLATPATVAWGFYSFHAKPALTVHSGDTVIMQTASTCGAVRAPRIRRGPCRANP